MEMMPASQKILSESVRVGLWRTSEMLRKELVMIGRVILPVAVMTVTGARALLRGFEDDQLADLTGFTEKTG